MKKLRAKMIKDHATWMALEYSQHVSEEVEHACSLAAKIARKSAKAYAKKFLQIRSVVRSNLNTIPV